MIRLFTGYDQRESIGWHVFCQSVMKFTSGAVSIIPVTESLGISLCGGSDGTNSFTKSRFLVPYLCGYEGWAIWADGADMMLRNDLVSLWALRDEDKAVQVVKHDYEPRFTRKYIGTGMEADNVSYPKKNWSSLILFNCSKNRNLTPEMVRLSDGKYLHRFGWLDDEQVSGLPREWNWLDEFGANDKASLIHYTNGIPAFRHYRDAIYSSEWRKHRELVLKGDTHEEVRHGFDSRAKVRGA